LKRKEPGGQKSWTGEILAAFLLVSGCRQDVAPALRKIVPHPVLDCDLPKDSHLVLTALGDFSGPRAADVANARSAEDVALPPDLRGVEVASRPEGFHGVGYAEPPDDVQLAIWSRTSSCKAIDEAIPPSVGGEAFTTFAGGRAILVAGLDPPFGAPINTSAFALVWDARTGEKLAPVGMAHRRAWATATAFGEGALVAGGLDRQYLPAKAVDSALVFRKGAFQEPPIALGDARARHGAVVLANGETLLVGGEGEDGSALSSLVAITPTNDPPFGQARLFQLGTLAKPRKSPTVLRLANDQVLVAGGFDEQGNAVSTLEWFAEDGATCTLPRCAHTPQELVARAGRAFVALSGGGALAVGGVDPSTSEPARDAWWITPEGAVEALPELTLFQRGTKALRLVPAADGAPFLWNGDSWFRFDPWQGTFVAADTIPQDGPDEDMPDPIAVDPGLFLWLARQVPGDQSQPANVRGFRHDVRGPFTSDADFFLAEPAHMAPDRLPVPGGAVWADIDGLHLTENAQVAITDTTYANVMIKGETDETAASELPELWLGDFAIARDCGWPSPSGKEFVVTRSGRNVEVHVDVGATKECPGPEGRVTIALGGSGTTLRTVRKLSVSRQ
jgi:hypothetical protein